MKKTGFWFLSILLVGFCAQAEGIFTALPINLMENADLSAEERGLMYRAQKDVEATMPPKMLAALKTHLPRKTQIYKITVKEEAEHIGGSSNRKGEIFINKKYLNNPLMLKKMLIHEWTHLYDFLNIHDPEKASRISWCQTWYGGNTHSRDDKVPDDCYPLLKIKSTLSTTPDFLEVGGWFLNIHGEGRRISETSFTLRSLDSYELRSPAEMFAVNMEAFLTDSEFQCRKPTMNRLLVTHFQYRPFPVADCSESLKIVNPQFNSASKALVGIDKKRLYQVHYLLASRGDGLSAKFGHSMFRLVMCAPQRKVVGPDCLKDIQYHIVLSFRAFVNTPEISNLAGIGGDYPSRLFFIPFAQVIEEYNKTELRDLQSYPLNLTRDEVERFLERSIETHWSYNGQYYFFSNNCAVESMNLLRSATLRPELMNESAQTPYGMRDVLNYVKMLDDDFLDNRDWAAQNGYLFISHQEHLEKALETVSLYTKVSEARDLEDWIEQSPLVRRYLFHKFLPAEKSLRTKYAAAFLLLESQAERTSEASLQSFIMNVIKNDNLSQEITDAVKKILALQSGFFEIKGELVTPAKMVAIGYGVPSSTETTSMNAKFESIAEKRSQSRGLLSELYNKLFQKEQIDAVTRARENKELFTKVILENR